MTHEIPKLLIDHGTLHYDGKFQGKANVMPLAYGRNELPLGRQKIWLFHLSGANADFPDGYDEPFLCMTPDGLIHLMPHGENVYTLSEATSADLQAHMDKQYKYYPSIPQPTREEAEEHIRKNFAGWCNDPLIQNWKAPETLRLLDEGLYLEIPPYREKRSISIRTTSATDGQITAGGFHWANTRDVQDFVPDDGYLLSITLTLWKQRDRRAAEETRNHYEHCGAFPLLAHTLKG